MNFDQAFSQLIKHEGGYVNHPDDPGGETNYGITKSVAEKHGYTGDMKTLPLSTAKYIYQRDYWDKIRADQLPEKLRYHVFDAAVNSGISQAIKWLQEAAGVKSDGIIGSITISAAASVTPSKYSAHRLRFMTHLKTWPVFGKGWARRIADNLEI